MPTAQETTWFPVFEFQDYTYESDLLTNSTCRWARGDLHTAQARRTPDGYTLNGTLIFAPGLVLDIAVTGTLGDQNEPATFQGSGTGWSGRTRGALYRLTGWAFPEHPIRNGVARVLSIRGAVVAVRGPDAEPCTDLAGMPCGTVGFFNITRTLSPVPESDQGLAGFLPATLAKTSANSHVKPQNLLTLTLQTR